MGAAADRPRDAKGRFVSVGLTRKCVESRVKTALIEDRPIVATTLLAPLLEGKIVRLSVDDPRLPKKTRGYAPYLVLIPPALLGTKENVLMVALPPYGAEMVRIGIDFKATVFVRLGLRFSLARALADALFILYLGGSHGIPSRK